MKIAIDPGHGMSNATAGVFDPGAVAREDSVPGSRHRLTLCADFEGYFEIARVRRVHDA